jgi:hypothetical protein
VPLLNTSFEHGLTARAPERQKLRQEFRGRLRLSFTASELILLPAVWTVKGDWQLWIVNAHAINPIITSIIRSRVMANDG